MTALEGVESINTADCVVDTIYEFPVEPEEQEFVSGSQGEYVRDVAQVAFAGVEMSQAASDEVVPGENVMDMKYDRLRGVAAKQAAYELMSSTGAEGASADEVDALLRQFFPELDDKKFLQRRGYILGRITREEHFDGAVVALGDVRHRRWMIETDPDADTQKGTPALSRKQLLALLGREEPVEGWQGQAECGTLKKEPFFPEKGQNAKIAQRACKACGVSKDCLTFALLNNEKFGVWGGTTPNKRTRMLNAAAMKARGEAMIDEKLIS